MFYDFVSRKIGIPEACQKQSIGLAGIGINGIVHIFVNGYDMMSSTKKVF